MSQQNSDATVEVSPALLRALRDPTFYPHPADRVEVIETHISWIFLAGEYAYKLKKPVKFGFLDFSTPELRRHFCAQELRLNQRYSPQIYLGLVGFGPSPQEPVWGGSPPIETAVRMRRFPESGRLDHLQSAGLLGPREIDAFASRIAQFHQHAARAGGKAHQRMRNVIVLHFRCLAARSGALLVYNNGLTGQLTAGLASLTGLTYVWSSRWQFQSPPPPPPLVPRASCCRCMWRKQHV